MAKVINAVFGGGLFATTAKVFQYDVGDKLRFLGVDLPEGYSVDFANSRTGESKTVLGDADGVEIPPECFIPGTEIYAWVVISDADGHYTKYQAKIPIYERAARTSVEPTPAQTDALDDAISALNSAVDTVHGIADNLNDQINAALEEAKESGDFDGPQGPQGERGPQGETGPQGQTGPQGPAGEDGYSPTVTVAEIAGGHRVTITDEDGDHVFDVFDGQGGGGDDEVFFADYGLTTSAEIEEAYQNGKAVFCIDGQVILPLTAWVDPITHIFSGCCENILWIIKCDSDTWSYTFDTVYTKPSGGIPKTDLAAAVQTSLGKADTALQNYTETDPTVPSWAKASSKPAYTASEVGAVASNQGVANANKVLTVNSSGVVVPEDNRFVVTLTPTAQDFSGVMDKTCAEITAAYEAGKDIWLEVDATSLGYELWRVKATIEAKANGENYGQVMAFLINLQLTPPSMIFILTEFNVAGDNNRYTTRIYPLASGQWTGGSF